MTRLSGLVADDDGSPLAGVYVTATLQGDRWLAGQTGQVDGFTDTYTGPDGRWTLGLTPAAAMAQDGTWWLVRVWQRASFGVNVPPDPGRVVDIAEPGVIRDGGQPPPPPGSDFVPRSSVGKPGGPAGPLDADGQLPRDQQPALRLVELADVEVADEPEASVLVRDPATGVFHSRPLSQLAVGGRGSTVWYVEQPPGPVLPEHWETGDWITVVAGEQRGMVYEVMEA